ncbi:CFEM domain-containing protein [Mycena chlorophos]|uniref:CFEM domain-containing protein n=1 Tax=Mycena chlorophos TaxID=658473 RepID=A0A8H6W479_MYCCL|nr:CFEM domain-containing protein [Mycena chlorophos]
MRFLQALAAASLVASASAVHLRRQIPGFPSCADNCLNNPTNLGGCSIADEKCLCQSTAYLQSTLSCINAACPSSADQATSVQGATSLCASFGVNLSSESAAIYGSATPGAASGSSPSAASTSAAATTSESTTSKSAAAKVTTSSTYRYLAAIVAPAFAVFVL